MSQRYIHAGVNHLEQDPSATHWTDDEAIENELSARLSHMNSMTAEMNGWTMQHASADYALAGMLGSQHQSSLPLNQQQQDFSYQPAGHPGFTAQTVSTNGLGQLPNYIQAGQPNIGYNTTTQPGFDHTAAAQLGTNFFPAAQPDTYLFPAAQPSTYYLPAAQQGATYTTGPQAGISGTELLSANPLSGTPLPTEEEKEVVWRQFPQANHERDLVLVDNEARRQFTLGSVCEGFGYQAVLDLGLEPSQYPTRQETQTIVERLAQNASKTKYGNENRIGKLFASAADICDIACEKMALSLPGQAAETRSANISPQQRHKIKKNYEVLGAEVRLFKYRATTSKEDPNSALSSTPSRRELKFLCARENAHAVLLWAHSRTDHGGRDKTFGEVSKFFSNEGLTKDLISKWIGHCPTCKSSPRSNGRGRTRPG